MNLPSIHELRKGQELSWAIVFDWLWPIAVAGARSHLANWAPDEIDDVAAECLEQLCDLVADNRVASTDELAPLATTISHNIAVDRLRSALAERRNINQTVSLDAIEEETEDVQADNPFHTLEAHETAEIVEELIQTLSPKQSAVVHDFFFKQLTYTEISEKRDIPIGTIGVLLTRSLEKLRKKISKSRTLLKEISPKIR